MRPTFRVVVRPVAADGRIAHGFHTQTERFYGEPLQCDAASPVGVDHGIDYCGYGATDTLACWRAATPTWILCLRDPRSKVLVRTRYSGRFGYPTVRHPEPQELAIRDGDRCIMPTGGERPSLKHHPSWVHDYICRQGVVYGPAHSDGIDRTRGAWRVDIFANANSLGRNRFVTTAYYVGNAH